MRVGRRIWSLATGMLAFGLLAGCSPEVGTERWCDRMQEKPKGDWTLEETRDYGRYCLLGTEKEE